MPNDLTTGSFTPIRPELVQAMNGDIIAAYVWAHIEFKQRINGEEYKATQPELMHALVLKRNRLQRTLNRLKDTGWLAWERSSWDDATSIYTAMEPDDTPDLTPDSPDSAHTDSPKTDSPKTGDIHSPETGRSTLAPKPDSLSSSKKVRLPKSKNVATPKTEPRPTPPEATQLAQLLADTISSNGSTPPTITSSWTTEIDRMHRIDKRTWEEIAGAIKWSQADTFWRTNILSPKKLRKHFDRMRLQATPPAPTEDRWTRLKREMAEESNTPTPTQPETLINYADNILELPA